MPVTQASLNMLVESSAMRGRSGSPAMADAGASAADMARVLKLAAGIFTEDESASLKALKDDIATVRKILSSGGADAERLYEFAPCRAACLPACLPAEYAA